MSKRVLVLVLVLDWSQCLPQGAGATTAMLRGRMTGFPPKKLGPWPPERQDKVDTICTVPLNCGIPTTRSLYPFGAANWSQRIHPGPSSSRSKFFYGVESVMRGNADSLLNCAADHRTRLRPTTSAVSTSR